MSVTVKKDCEGFIKNKKKPHKYLFAQAFVQMPGTRDETMD